MYVHSDCSMRMLHLAHGNAGTARRAREPAGMSQPDAFLRRLRFLVADRTFHLRSPSPPVYPCAYFALHTFASPFPVFLSRYLPNRRPGGTLRSVQRARLAVPFHVRRVPTVSPFYHFPELHGGRRSGKKWERISIFSNDARRSRPSVVPSVWRVRGPNLRRR